MEDEAESVHRFQNVLGKTGRPYFLSVYHSGLSALAEITNEDQPDVIVIDWFLPVAVTDWFLPIVDATAFMAELRSVEEFDGIPVAVFLGNWCFEVEPRELGAYFCLKKPIDVDQMRDLLTMVSR